MQSATTAVDFICFLKTKGRLKLAKGRASFKGADHLPYIFSRFERMHRCLQLFRFHLGSAQFVQWIARTWKDSIMRGQFQRRAQIVGAIAGIVDTIKFDAFRSTLCDEFLQNVSLAKIARRKLTPVLLVKSFHLQSACRVKMGRVGEHFSDKRYQPIN